MCRQHTLQMAEVKTEGDMSEGITPAEFSIMPYHLTTSLYSFRTYSPFELSVTC